MSSSTSGRKRRLATAPSAASSSSKAPAPITFLSPRHLLLEVPDTVDTSLPIWMTLLSQQVEQSWQLQPYGLTVSFSARPATLGQAPPTKPPAGQSGGSGGGGGMTLTFLQGQLLGSTSLLASLPLIITQSPPAPPPPPPPSPSLSNQSPEAPPPVEFHTKASSTVLVCDAFLLGVCTEGRACPLHHTPLPFHWQLWCVATHSWLDLPAHAQLLVESSYCEEEMDNITIHLGGELETLLLDFEEMELDGCPEYDAVRRLCNTSDPALNPHFPNQMKIYWWDDSSWQEYSQVASKVLLASRSAWQLECELSVWDQRYKVDFTCMTQTNVATGYQRAVRCRPVYRPPRSLRPHLKTSTLPFPAPQGQPTTPCDFSVDPLEPFSSWYPPVWGVAPPNQDHLLVGVPEGSPAYESVQDLFHQSLPESQVVITSIQMVQNLLHWDLYQRYRSHLVQSHRFKDPVERHLFHGTSQAAALDICRHNFDPRLSGAHGASLGSASYFARKAAYAAAYAAGYPDDPPSDGLCHVFLAKVLVGRSALGRGGYRRPPLLPRRGRACEVGNGVAGGGLYDSCVDNTRAPSVFAVFDSCHCYPYFLIRYRDTPHMVTL